MMDRLANLAGGHPKRVLIFAGVFFLLAGALGSGVADRLDPYGADDPDKEAFIAKEKLEAAGYRDPQAIVLIQDADPTTPEGAERVTEIAKAASEVEGVRGVSGFLETKSDAFVSKDGQSTYVAVQFEATEDDALQDTGEALVSEFEGDDDVLVGGNAVAQQQINENVESDLQRAELLAFPILFLLSLLFFRSLVAAALPLLIGGLAIVSTFLLLTVASEIGSISIFALNLVTGLGPGPRDRLQPVRGLALPRGDRQDRRRHAGPAAHDGDGGRTVAYSSVTVAGALAALAVFPQRFLYSMGIGGALVALAAALISLTVLPAILALLGDRVNSLSPKFLQRRAEADSRAATQGFWYRLSRTVMRVPGRIALASATFLIVLGIPFFNINFTSVDAQVLPEETSARMVDNELRAEFPPFRDSPVQVYAEGSNAEVESLADEAAPARRRRRGAASAAARRQTHGRSRWSPGTRRSTSRARTSSPRSGASTRPRSSPDSRRTSSTSRTAWPSTCRSSF